MNNSNRDNFERIVQLAEFGAKRHDERRQVDFRVFIAYMTLLALAFSQIDKISNLNLPAWIIWAGSGLIHLSYFLWEIRISKSQSNDALRRNFYLKKAECILHHLTENPDTPFQPRKDVCVTISLGANVEKTTECPKKGKIYESELFAMHEPPIELVSPMLHVWKHLGQFNKDWSRPFQILIPTVILSLLIFALLQKG